MGSKMDETSAAIFLACRLARDFEANLHTMKNQPEFLWRKSDEIIEAFNNVKQRILQMGFVNIEDNNQLQISEQMEGTTSGVQEAVQQWLMNNNEDMGLDLQGGIDRKESYWVGDMGFEMTSGGELVVGRWLREHGAMVTQPPMQLSSSGRSGGSSSSSPIERRRKGAGERRRVIIDTSQMGKTEIHVPPDEDGHAWRKYGQKDILYSKFPRSYFRCTNQKLHNCPAKKQVQRLDSDPNMFEVLYINKHTCHLSPATAPPPPPPPPPSSNKLRSDIIQEQPTNIHLPPLSNTTTRWLSMNILRGSRQANMQKAAGEVHGSGGSVMVAAQGGASGCYVAEDQPVAYMADTMFNSGSSSNNSMDFIFSTTENRLESRKRKF